MTRLSEYRLQPNAWSCGPTALYNGLTALGVKCGLFNLCNMSACTKEHGTPEAGLRGAAWYYHVDFLTSQCRTHEYFREAVRVRCPMLMCVDRDSDGPYAHWITVLRSTKRHVWIADPARPGPVERRLTWRQFLARAVTVLGPGEFQYTYHPLVKRRSSSNGRAHAL